MSASNANKELMQIVTVKKRGVPESQVVNKVTELIFEGADVNKPFQSPSTVNALLRRPELMGTLIRHGAKVTPYDLMNAIEAGNVAAVEKMLSAPINLEFKTGDGTTALMVAAGSGVVPIVELLIHARASLYKRDKEGNGVLHYAARSGSKEMIRYLLMFKRGVNPNNINNNGETPLMVAADAYAESMRKADLDVLKELSLVSDFGVKDGRGKNVWTRVMEDHDEETANDVKKEMLQVFKDEIEDRIRKTLLVQKTMNKQEKTDIELPDDIIMKIATTGLHETGSTAHVMRKFSARSKLNTRK